MPESQHWMVKQEPTAYSWDQFVKDGGTTWTGVRNFQARNNLQAMRKGDQVLFYHSVVGKEVVGIAKVAKVAYPDPTADDDAWVCVDLAPFKPLKHPVSLAQIKATPSLASIGLLRQSRLSVIPLSAEEFSTVVELGKASQA
jgi:predicted RNA-binding protein with PUA-like domain